MTDPAPELSRPVAVDRAQAGLSMEVIASAEECAAIAARMGLPAIERLACRFVTRWDAGDAVAAEGRLAARVVQTCVVTLENFPADIEEDFRVRFVPAGTESEELDLDADDEIPFEGATIDLGAATAEQLALALDPFPRKPGVEPELPPEEASGPFAALARLRRE